MSRPQQVRTDAHLFLLSQGQALTHSTHYVSSLSTASASVVYTAPTFITARRQGLFHNNDSDDADSDPYSDQHPSDYDKGRSPVNVKGEAHLMFSEIWNWPSLLISGCMHD